MVGALGIGAYFMERGNHIVTYDCDLMLPREAGSLAAALAVLLGQGFELAAGGEPLVAPDEVIVAGLVEAGVCVRAAKGRSVVDLVLQAGELDFEAMWPRSREFVYSGRPVRVAPLADLIASKRAAGRTKDKLFLEQFREIIEELQARDRREPPNVGA